MYPSYHRHKKNKQISNFIYNRCGTAPKSPTMYIKPTQQTIATPPTMFIKPHIRHLKLRSRVSSSNYKIKSEFHT